MNIIATGWRHDRLARVLRIAARIMGLHSDAMPALVLSVEDRAGRLHVTWRHAFTPAQVAAFATAWELCGEDECNTRHAVASATD